MDPITRKEMFLAKAAGQDVTTPEPITREEMFLEKIAKTGGGGAGSANWKLLTDITLEEDATIEQIDYDAKYKEMYGVITLPKVDPKISAGATCVFLGANLYYVSLGDTNYSSLIQVHTTIVDDDTVFVVFRNGGDSGLGQNADIHTRSRPTPWEMRKCKFGVALPTGTTIKVFGKE